MSYLSKLKPQKNVNNYQKYARRCLVCVYRTYNRIRVLNINNYNDQGCTRFEPALLFPAEELKNALKKQRLQITHLEKMRFIKVTELKLFQVELFSFFAFMCVAANASELFCMAHLTNIQRFLYHFNLSF